MNQSRPNTTSNHNLQMQLRVWDRFIRSGNELKKRHLSLASNSASEDPTEQIDAIMFRKLYSRKEVEYKRLVARALNVPEPPDVWSPAWPVRHRKVPAIGTPNAVLDLPNIRNDYCSSIMDWSSLNLLTVGFPRSVHLYNAETQSVFRIPESDPICVQWEPTGRHLFAANVHGNYKLLDFNKVVVLSSGDCMPCHPHCYGTCSTFHPYYKLLFVGCSAGTIVVFHYDQGLQMHYKIQQYHESVTTLAISCDGLYLAAASMQTEVTVYSVYAKYVCLIMTIKLGGPCRAVAWHPWQGGCLVVADSEGFMACYEVARSTAPEAAYDSAYNSSILKLLFSEHTAELVVSQRVYAYTGGAVTPRRAETQLNVVASFDRVVDRMEGHAGRVLNMAWSPDGSQLATAGSEETVRIWDFLPRNFKQRTKPSSKKHGKVNYASMCLDFHSRMGFLVR